MVVKLEEVVRFLEGMEQVKAAYLFGSCARGEAGSLSDVDIGVLLDGEVEESEAFKLRLELINGLSSILNTDKLDVVVMNQASLLLNYNILREGKVLHSKDERARIEFETYVLSRYLDRKYYDERHVDAGLKRIAEEGIL